MTHDNQSVYRQAQKLMAADETEAAYDLLWQSLINSPLDLKLNLLYGKAGMRLKLYDSAAAAYERVLKVDSKNIKARFNLGVAYYRLGAYGMARKEFNNILEAGSSPKTIKQAHLFLQSIEKRQNSRQLFLSTRLGRIHNTNINTGPTADSIKTGHTAQADWGTTVDFTLNHNWDIGLPGYLSWDSTVSSNNYFYDKGNFNFNSLKVNTGPKFSELKRYKIHLPFAVDIIEYDSEPYAQFYGIIPQLDWYYTKDLSIIFRTTVHRQNYSDNTKYDGYYYKIAVMPLFYWNNQKFLLKSGLAYEWKDSTKDVKSYDGPLASVMFFARMNKWIKALISFNYRRPTYNVVEPVYNKTRKRNHYKALAKLFASLPWQGMRVTLSFDYTNDDSNIEDYSYDRERTILMIEKRF